MNNLDLQKGIYQLLCSKNGDKKHFCCFYFGMEGVHTIVQLYATISKTHLLGIGKTYKKLRQNIHPSNFALWRNMQISFHYEEVYMAKHRAYIVCSHKETVKKGMTGILYHPVTAM